MIPHSRVRFQFSRYSISQATRFSMSALLRVKKWTRRMESLRDENDCSQDRKDYQHDRKRDREIDRALNKPVQRVFQRLLAQTDEPKPAVFEMRHRVAQPFLQVA